MLEIHPHWIVESVKVARFRFFLFRFFCRFRMIHDFNLQLAELGENFIQRFRRGQRFRQRLADVVESEIALFFGEMNQLFNFCGQFGGALGWRGGNR